MEELNSKLMSKQDELIDRQSKWMEVTETLRKKEDEMKKTEARCVVLEWELGSRNLLERGTRNEKIWA